MIELSSREMDVLIRLADGMEDSEVATDLFLSVNTVKHYVKSLLLSLGAKNRTHAVALAYHRGILLAPVPA